MKTLGVALLVTSPLNDLSAKLQHLDAAGGAVKLLAAVNTCLWPLQAYFHSLLKLPGSFLADAAQELQRSVLAVAGAVWLRLCIDFGT